MGQVYAARVVKSKMEINNGNVIAYAFMLSSDSGYKCCNIVVAATRFSRTIKLQSSSNVSMYRLSQSLGMST